MEFPSSDEIFINAPLYKTIDLRHLDSEQLTSFIENIRNPSGTLDTYCLECKRQSTFSGYRIQLFISINGEECGEEDIFGTEFKCARDNSHKIYFIFLLKNGSLMKLGQYPSIADMQFPEVRKYRKVLGDEKYKEFTKAIGLVSHGVGVGSFVYLRRIFEDLLEAAHLEASHAMQWNEIQYQEAQHVEDRIQVLSPYLPNFLVEHKQLYSILSKGVHSLTEEECLTYFSIIKTGIELILDEKIEAMERRRKINQGGKEIEALHQKLKEAQNGN
jgi:hypothetical protein